MSRFDSEPFDHPEPCLREEGEEQEAPQEDASPGPRHKWLNRAIAVLLAPVVWVWGNAFFTLFYKETVDRGFWRTEEFYHFFLGADIALLAFIGLRGAIDCTVPWYLWLGFGRFFLGLVSLFGLRRFFLPTAEYLGWLKTENDWKQVRVLVLVYVFGHELTHAVWVWLMGGRVGRFKVRSHGGYITTDKQNFWIALAPYFYPIYSVAVVILYAIAALFFDMAPHTRWLFFAIGMTWSFHVCFTAWMIPKGQSDISDNGHCFSFVVILLMNLAVITGLLLLTAPGVTFTGFGRQFVHHAGVLVWNTAALIQWLREALRHGP